MTKDRWNDLLDTIRERFTIIEKGTEPREEGPGTIEFVEFESPVGRVRLELSTHPVVLGKHAVGGKKMGAGSKVAYEYSDTDNVTSFTAWKRVGGEWEEIDASMFAGKDA